MRFACASALVLAAASAARADGVYVTDSIGPGVVHDQLATKIDDTTLRMRLSIGMRIGGWAIEPFVSAEATGLGRPAYDSPTVSGYGLDVKRLMRVRDHLDMYLRGSMSQIAFPDQAPCCFVQPLLLPTDAADMYGYSGRGLGVGVGAQLSGTIPGLGLRGGVFVEESYDYYRLLPSTQWEDYNRPHIDASITRFSLGLALGSDF